MGKSMGPLLIHEKGCPVEEKKNRREMLDPIIWGKMEGGGGGEDGGL